MTPSLRTMGGPNYAQFGDSYDDGADVRTKANHAGRKDYHLVDGNRLGEREESGGAIGCTNSTTQEAIGGRGASKGEGEGGMNEEQGTVQSDAPTPAGEDPATFRHIHVDIRDTALYHLTPLKICD